MTACVKCGAPTSVSALTGKRRRRCDRHVAKEAEYAAKRRDKRATYWREYSAANREKIIARGRKYRGDNPAKRAESCRKYREANKESIARGNSEYVRRNNKKIAAYARKHRAGKGRAVYLAVQHRRRARKYGACDGTVTPEIISELQSFSYCHYCGQLTEPKLREVDHVVPLAKGGLHSVANLAMACRPCNRRKQAMTLDQFKARQAA